MEWRRNIFWIRVRLGGLVKSAEQVFLFTSGNYHGNLPLDLGLDIAGTIGTCPTLNYTRSGWQQAGRISARLKELTSTVIPVRG